MISESGWKASLLNKIKALSTAGAPRIAVVGVGNCLFGDDGVGSRVAQDLGAVLPPGGNWLVVDGSTAPENYSGVLRSFSPDLVVLVDAAEMDASVGQIAALDWRKTSGCGASTHAFPMYMLASYLEVEIGCEVFLLGVQPENVLFGLPYTEPVLQAAGELVGELAALLLER